MAQAVQTAPQAASPQPHLAASQPFPVLGCPHNTAQLVYKGFINLIWTLLQVQVLFLFLVLVLV